MSRCPRTHQDEDPARAVRGPSTVASVMTTGADRLLAAVAAYGLGEAAAALPTVPLDDDGFAAHVRDAEGHRLLGLLGAAIGEGEFPVTASQAASFEERLRGWLGHTLRVERMLLQAVDALDAAGLDHRVLKGVALAHTVYPDPAWRVFGDVDLLVPPDALTRAAEVVAGALGATRAQPELRPGFENRFGKEVLLRVGSLELDLHRTFVEGALGLTMELDDLWGPPEHCEIGGRRLAVLPPPVQVLHAAYAVVLGDWPPRLVARRDLAQVLTVRDPDAEEVLRLARRWRAEAVLARALDHAWATLRPPATPALVDWARTHRPGRLDRVLVGSHVGPSRAYTRHAAALLVLPGIRRRASYLRALALPQREYLEARGMSRWRFLQRPLRVAKKVAGRRETP